MKQYMLPGQSSAKTRSPREMRRMKLSLRSSALMPVTPSSTAAALGRRIKLELTTF